MLLQLKPLFLGETERMPIDTVLDLSDVEWNGEHPFLQPVPVKGQVLYAAGVVTLQAVATPVLQGNCDRCAAPIRQAYDQHIEHVLVTSLEDPEHDDELVLLENFQLVLDELVRDDLILNMPSKTLCRPDCQGLCPQCGKDLNQGPCGCRTKTTDPRLEVLKNWMKQE